jgi:hypothetical protein
VCAPAVGIVARLVKIKIKLLNVRIYTVRLTLLHRDVLAGFEFSRMAGPVHINPVKI